ncbi:hypothetical protein D9756_010141 [Leucocoprinus leucothites]|uniref:Uncharacterized protein n=1 Tax=Leucocoprinus leucothites TaxID=201217 RepID=A0A8H5FTC0_9AGAR|nr:hypothetical protein D9756_010141 [Leucoagaricus leucothites]
MGQRNYPSLSTSVTESTDNQEVIRSIIRDVQTDEALVDVIKSAVKATEGAKPKKTSATNGKEAGKKGGKWKQDEDEDAAETEGED